MSQLTKDQHFVPEFYLRRFSLNGMIVALDLPAGRILKPRPYQSVCYATFFHAQQTGVQDDLSQLVEDWLDVPRWRRRSQ
jgi:hypothetical protein